MSYGTAFVSPLPTPGVTASPTFETQLIAWCQEAQGKLAQKISNGDVSLLTAGDVSHTNRIWELSPADGALIGATWDPVNLYVVAVGAADTVTIPIAVQVGERILVAKMYGRNSGTAWNFRIMKIDKTSGTVTTVAGPTSSGVAAGTIEPISFALTETILDNFAYVAKWTSGLALNRCLGLRIEVDRP
jgi:hypothetical protein